MKDKPQLYKNKFNSIKSKVQNEYYYKSKKEEEDDIVDVHDKKNNTLDLNKKINSIFNSPNYVYQADVNIMYKSGESMNKKIVGIKDNYLLTLDGEKIFINDIYDIK